MKYFFTVFVTFALHSCMGDISSPEPDYEFPKECDESGNCECPAETMDCGSDFECYDLTTDILHCGECNQGLDNGNACENGIVVCGDGPSCAIGEDCEPDNGVCVPEPTPICGPRAGGEECPAGEFCREGTGQCEPSEGGQGQ